MIGKLTRAMCNLSLSRGDECVSLPKCLEVPSHMFDVLEKGGFIIVTESPRVTVTGKLLS